MTRCPHCEAMAETLLRCSTCQDQGCTGEDCIFEDGDDECFGCQGASEDLDNLDDVKEDY